MGGPRPLPSQPCPGGEQSPRRASPSIAAPSFCRPFNFQGKPSWGRLHSPGPRAGAHPSEAELQKGSPRGRRTHTPPGTSFQVSLQALACPLALLPWTLTGAEISADSRAHKTSPSSQRQGSRESGRLDGTRAAGSFHISAVSPGATALHGGRCLGGPAVCRVRCPGASTCSPPAACPPGPLLTVVSCDERPWGSGSLGVPQPRKPNSLSPGLPSSSTGPNLSTPPTAPNLKP